MNMPILFEDEYLMVINKLAGVVVNRAESVVGETIQDWVDIKLKNQNSKIKTNSETENLFKQRSGVAHRLDKETSGCLLIAKEPAILVELLRQFKERTVHKEYTALVYGKVEPRAGEWRLPIGRSHKKHGQFKVDPTGKISETGYRVEAEYEGYTLLKLFPKTGRTHQLRVHLKHVKHPVVGDALYGGGRGNKDRQWCPRVFLHASVIEFNQPIDKRLIKISAPLASELKRVLDQLRRVDG